MLDNRALEQACTAIMACQVGPKSFTAAAVHCVCVRLVGRHERLARWPRLKVCAAGLIGWWCVLGCLHGSSLRFGGTC